MGKESMMTPMEFEKKNEQELRTTSHQNELPTTLALVETPTKTGASSIEELKNELLEEYYTIKAKKKSEIKLKLAIGIVAIAIFSILDFLTRMRFQINFVGIPTVLLTTAYLISARQKQVMLSLSYIDDLSLVGVICEMSNTKDFEIQTAARNSLTKILPKLNASDSELLNRDQRQALRNQLLLKRLANNSAYVEFQLAVLKAYEQIGGAEDKAVVHNLASKQFFNVRVREAAKSCLPYLEIRIAEEQERHQLLRASSYATLETDELLRPAKGSNDANPNTLLRPSDEVEKR